MEDISNKIKQAINARGITQAELARTHNISEAFVSNLARNRDISPSVKAFVGIVNHLELAEDIFGYSQKSEISENKIARLEAENTFLKAKIKYLETLKHIGNTEMLNGK